MYLLEYMIYHMKPFGVGHYTCPSEAQPIVDKLLAGASEGGKVVGGTEEQNNKDVAVVEVAKKDEKNEAKHR